MMKPQLTKQALIASHRSLYLFLMGLGLFAVCYWASDLYFIYQKQQNLSRQASELRDDIYTSAREFGQILNQYDDAIQQQSKAMTPPPPPPPRSAPFSVEKDGKITRHEVAPHTTVEQVIPPRPRVEDTNIPSKIQLLGLLEIELSETTSWHTVLKLIVSVLTTLLGIKTINYWFKKLESSLAH